MQASPAQFMTRSSLNGTPCQCRPFDQRANKKWARSVRVIRIEAAGGSLAAAGPKDAAPGYSKIDAQPLNRVVYGLFRNRMARHIGQDSKLDGYHCCNLQKLAYKEIHWARYAAIIDMTRRLNSLPTPRDTQVATVAILRSLFPPWLPGAFKVMFSQPLPTFSCQLNAWATWLTCQWLMGPCEVNDVEIDGGSMAPAHGVLVKRCRYLEESGCASICINSCKVPTQEFFEKHMGLPLTMTPNYEDFSCQFAFGKTPLPQGQDEAFATPCFVQCPTARKRSRCYNITPTE